MTRNDSRFSLRRAVLLARYCLLAFAVACASSKAASIQSTPSARPLSITATDLRSVNATSTFDAIRQLRPDFLRASARSDRNATGPVVYVDGVFAGDVSWLEWIQIAEVRDITFIHPTEARFRFGPTCPCGGGIVAVQTVAQASR